MRLVKCAGVSVSLALLIPFLSACGGGGSSPGTGTTTSTITSTTATSTSTASSGAPKAATALPVSDRLLEWMGKNPYPNINTAIFDAQTGARIRLELVNKGMPPQDYQVLLSGSFDPATGRAKDVNAIARVDFGNVPYVNSLSKSAPKPASLAGLNNAFTVCASVIFQDWAQPWKSQLMTLGASDCTTGAGLTLLLQPVDGSSSGTQTNGDYSPVSMVNSATGALTGFIAVKNGMLYLTDKQLGNPKLIANSAHTAATMLSPWLGIDKQLLVVDGSLRMLDVASLTLGPSLGALNSADVVAIEADAQNIYVLTSAPVTSTVANITLTSNYVKALKISRAAPYVLTELMSVPGLPVSFGMSKNTLAIMTQPEAKNVCSTCSSNEVTLYSVLKERGTQSPWTSRVARSGSNFTAIYSHPDATQFVVSSGPQTMPLLGSNPQQLTNFLFSGTGGISSNIVEQMDESLKTQNAYGSTIVAGKLLRQSGYGSTAINYLVTVSFLSTGPVSSVNALNLQTFQSLRMDSDTNTAASLADLSKSSYSFSGLDYGSAMILGVTASDGSLVNTKFIEAETVGSMR